MWWIKKFVVFNGIGNKVILLFIVINLLFFYVKLVFVVVLGVVMLGVLVWRFCIYWVKIGCNCMVVFENIFWGWFKVFMVLLWMYKLKLWKFRNIYI